MVNLASQFKVVISYEAYLFSNASLSRPSWPHVSEVLPAICDLREKLVPHCDCNIILHNSNSKPVWTSPIGQWVKKGRKTKEENSEEKISFWSFLWVKCLGFRRRLKSEPFRKIKSDCCTFDLNQKEAKKAGTTNIIEKVCWVRYYWYWMRARYSATVWERPAEIYATWYRATCYVIRATVQRTR